MPDLGLENVYEVLDRTERPYSAVHNISVILSAVYTCYITTIIAKDVIEE